MSDIDGSFTIEVRARMKSIDGEKRFSRVMQPYIKFVNETVVPVITEFGGLFGIVTWSGKVIRLADPGSFERALERNLPLYFEAYKVSIKLNVIEEGGPGRG